MSAAEKQARFCRLGSALQTGTHTDELRARGFTWGEINDARTFWKIEPRAYRKGIVHRP